MKPKTAWFCKECGAQSPKWEGKCPACGEWNTMVEEKLPSTTSGKNKPFLLSQTGPVQPIAVSEIEASETPRIKMPSAELNRVLGGGLVPGSMVLIGGEPGIGKSTLVLQNTLSIKSRKILYVSGEESPQQIKMRAQRLGRLSDNVFILSETSLESIMSQIEKMHPGMLVIDSIQTLSSEELESAPGSVSQIRECAARLLRVAKETGLPIMMIGHITKEGYIAGPKILEHIVDTVLQFEGDSQQMYRILRSVKNRFGSTSEIGIYEMNQTGLREVVNPSELLLTHHDADLSGTAIGVAMDGQRPFMIEAQALVSSAAYGTPQRSVTGFDPRRMNMLLAVMEKRVGFRLSQKDVFLNIAGGIRVNDPALDLAVTAAIMSSNVDIALPSGVCMAGEIGLSGEIRPVPKIDGRIREAQKLGFKTIYIPSRNLKGVSTRDFDIEIIEVPKVQEALKLMMHNA